MSDEVQKQKPKKQTFKVKDEHFNKVKSTIKNGAVKEADADFRNISISGTKLTLTKGQSLTKEQVALFDAGAKKHWLTNG